MTNSMSCQDIELRLEAAHDSELLPAEAEAVATHLRGCTHCAARARELQSLSDALHNAFPHHSAPTDLKARIIADVASMEHASTRRGWRVYLPRAASLAAMACIGWIASSEFHARGLAVGPAMGAGTSEANTSADTVANELVASHVRSLLANHLTDVTSTDQHTVKPWFDGKLDYAPDVRDFVAQGFPLLGGRLDFVRGHPVAALVYGRRKHLINLFVWPAPRQEPDRILARNGYLLRHWVSGGMSYWAVSDVAPVDLAELEHLYVGGDRSP